MSNVVANAPAGRGKKEAPICYHCGTACLTDGIVIGEKHFCCDGCKLVYQILDSNGLCNYYELEQHPGLSQIKGIRKDKFAYLDDSSIAEKLCSFRAGDYSIITLYLPGIHCASCMWLLEHMSRINPAITQSRVSFSTKEITIHFRHEDISLRQIAELLATIGYEPYISLDDAEKKEAGRKGYDRKRIYKLGIAGFCFGNIMMLAFPEYFGGEGLEHRFALLFRYASLLLSTPVVFYCAAEFFVNAWKGLRSRTLNIDAPIALAILITYTRSLYEILTATGSGYLDSMSGIVFFMLVGRAVQERTYRSISFHRDYKAYFPIAVTAVTEGGLQSRSLHELKPGDVVQLANEEIIPADGTVLKGDARIDYSFVTGESEPLHIPAGQKAYAGGRQMGGQMQMVIEKPVAGSYLTSLWNNHAFAKDKQTEAYKQSSVHRLSNWFTVVLFSLAALTAIWWAINDPSKIIPAVSAMLIVACPCALLLSATFTNGSMMRLLSNNGLFLRDATVIETLGTADHIVFDKTGTLTTGNTLRQMAGSPEMSGEEKTLVYAVASRSNHPRSRALVELIGAQEHSNVLNWEEVPGAGVRGMLRGQRVLIGNALFTGSPKNADLIVRIDGSFYYFNAAPVLRTNIADAIARLRYRFGLSLLSGDNSRQERDMRNLFGNSSSLLFSQKPEDKLAYIERLQQLGHKVVMLGDGLNDSGALQQSNAGITLAEDVNNFTPSCDAILDAKKVHQLPGLMALARWGRYTIRIAFVISILYNIVGLSFAVQGTLSPMIAAILMPASTLSIVMISVGVTSVVSRLLLRKSN
jgi:Cu+-exporting ATPase